MNELTAEIRCPLQFHSQILSKPIKMYFVCSQDTIFEESSPRCFFRVLFSGSVDLQDASCYSQRLMKKAVKIK